MIYDREKLIEESGCIESRSGILTIEQHDRVRHLASLTECGKEVKKRDLFNMLITRSEDRLARLKSCPDTSLL